MKDTKQKNLKRKKNEKRIIGLRINWMIDYFGLCSGFVRIILRRACVIWKKIVLSWNYLSFLVGGFYRKTCKFLQPVNVLRRLFEQVITTLTGAAPVRYILLICVWLLHIVFRLAFWFFP